MPIARIVAKYQDIREEEGAKVDDDDAGVLPHELLLCVGARVLTGNLSNANVEGHVDKERLAADGSVQWESRNDQGIALRRVCSSLRFRRACWSNLTITSVPPSFQAGE